MVTTWVLILFAHVGPLADGNSNALTSVPGFGSQQECQAAGGEAKKLARATVKIVDFVCVKQTRATGS